MKRTNFILSAVILSSGFMEFLEGIIAEPHTHPGSTEKLYMGAPVNIFDHIVVATQGSENNIPLFYIPESE